MIQQLGLSTIGKIRVKSNYLPSLCLAGASKLRLSDITISYCVPECGLTTGRARFPNLNSFAFLSYHIGKRSVIMALPPKFGGQLFSSVSPKSIHTVELYLDYVCPFSAKMFKTVYNSVFPLVDKKYAAKVQFIFHQQIQPWHPSSTLAHEAGAAVLRLAPTKFYEFSNSLFEHQAEYFDVSVVHETRNETYQRLAKLAEGVGIQEGKLLNLLRVSDKVGDDGSLNIGNAVTNDVKLMVKVVKLPENLVART